MCGILGIVWKNKECISQKTFRSLLQSQAHRGPDENSCTFFDKCWLGHNRLSIVDLLSSQQPMSSKCNRHTIVYNGEIYNYKELGEFLYSHNIDCDQCSDTSILLHGFLAFGHSFLDKVNGMYSFAIYDNENHSVTLVRDRLGKKPLFYAKTDYGLIFSSSLKTISRSGMINKNISQEAVYIFMKYGFIPEERCIYSFIKKVKSSEIMIYENEQIRKNLYWKVPNKIIYQKNKKIISKIKSIIKSSIKMRILQSDVEVGSFLSGGIDSSGVTSIAAKAIKSNKIKAFHIIPDKGEYDESKWAKKLSVSSSVDLFTQEIKNEETLNHMRMIVDFMDEPLGDSSALPTFQVSKYSSKSVKVTLSGEGGDELFLGYDWQRKFIQTHYLRQLSRVLFLKIKNPLSILNTKWRRFIVLINLIFLRDEDAYEFLYSGGNKELLFSLLNKKFKKTIEILETDLVSNKMSTFKGTT
ncbi:asparagine synthase (glutamine-hydrolyzing), partial [Amylibacter sp.]|nr:asparagine synthase (glutamine-hydrolyzing) [Amylibacter sp.]